jgi:hypothetical protein
MNYIKYNNFSEICKNDEIKIIANNDWSGMCGIVERIVINENNNDYNMAVIFCMSKPDTRYLVHKWNIEDIEIVLE